MFVYQAQITRMVDADTFDLDIDLGFDVWTKQRIRLSGIDSPERYTDEGKAAESYLREEFQMPAKGEPPINCTVQTEKPKRGKYGRYVAQIFIGDTNLNESLVLAGHAIHKSY